MPRLHDLAQRSISLYAANSSNRADQLVTLYHRGCNSRARHDTTLRHENMPLDRA